MRIRILEPEVSKEYDGWDFDHWKYISSMEIESYDRFIKFLEFIKEKDKDVKVGADYYSVIDYHFNFPEDDECVPSLDVFVCGAY